MPAATISSVRRSTAIAPRSASCCRRRRRRWRVWSRGFNQSVLVARELGSVWHIPTAPNLLRRVKRTQPLKGMSHSQRRKTVAGAFQVRPSSELEGRTIVLIDDVLTSGVREAAKEAGFSAPRPVIEVRGKCGDCCKA